MVNTIEKKSIIAQVQQQIDNLYSQLDALSAGIIRDVAHIKKTTNKRWVEHEIKSAQDVYAAKSNRLLGRVEGLKVSLELINQI